MKGSFSSITNPRQQSQVRHDLYEENAVNITAVMVCVQIPVSKTKHVYKKSAFPPPSLYAGNMVQWEGRGLFLSRYPI